MLAAQFAGAIPYLMVSLIGERFYKMNEIYLFQDGETNKCQILLDVGTKNREKGMEKGDEIVNDLLSAIDFTLNRYGEGGKDFKKSLKKIKKSLWKCIK